MGNCKKNEMIEKVNKVVFELAKQSTVETACGWVLYQPNVPEEMKNKFEEL